VEHHAQKELGEVTNPIFEVLLPGIDPFNLFLSNLRSTRFGSFPNSDGFSQSTHLNGNFCMT